MGTAALAEAAEAPFVGPAEVTEPGAEACAGVAAALVLGVALVDAVGVEAEAVVGVGGKPGAVVGVGDRPGPGPGAEAEAEAEAVVGAVGGTGVEAAVGEEESEMGDQPNVGCDAGDCGKRAAGFPLWMPPFSSARTSISGLAKC